MSMVGATYVLQDILKNKKRRNESIKRIVAAMSISDLICCFIGPFLGSLMIDEAEVQVWGQGTMGNRTTCTIQGFLITTFVTSSYAYNTTLAVSHLLMVRYGFNDRRLRSLEPYLLYPPFILGLIFAIIALFFQAYHFDSIAGPVCMISAIPIGCDRSDSDTECVQGQYRKILYWTFTGVVCVLNGVTGLSMFLLYRSVLEQQRRGERYSFRRLNSNTLRRSSVRAGRGLGAGGAGLGAGGAGGGSRRFSLRRSSFVAPRRTLSSTIGRQGLWYSASYFLTLFPSLIVAIISFVFEAKVPYWLAIVAGLTLPMLGFANAIVYARPRYVKLRIDFPHLGFGRSVIHTIQRTKPPRRQIQQHEQQKKSKQTPANPNQNQNQQLPASATTTTTTTTHTNTSIFSSIRNKTQKVLYSMSINLRIFKGESQNKKEQRDVDLDDIGVGVDVDVDAEVSSVVAMASKKSKSDLKLKPKQNPSKGLKLTFGTKNNADVDVNVHADADVGAGVIVDVDVDVDVEANKKETNVELFDIDVEQANNNETNLDKGDTGTRSNHDDDDHT